MSDLNEILTLDDIDQLYVNIRRNNQFKYMECLPTYLRQKFDDKLPIPAKTSNKYSYNGTSNSKLPTSKALVMFDDEKSHLPQSSSVLERHDRLLMQKPEWHAPWKLSKVINGHLGWVRCVESDPVDNEWFATGSSDTTIKIWDLASGTLKLTLAGHIMSVRDLAISKRHTYLFSASEDKLVKCWDLEKNMAIRDYHGHLSGVHSVDIHPTLDLIMTAGRDSVVRLWDIRTRIPVQTLVGHKSPINKVKCLPVDPQVISCSTDATIRLWDIVAGKSAKILTHHKRAVRDIAINPNEFSFTSASANDVRSWKLPEGSLLTNFNSKDTGIINSLCVNQDNVLAAGGDDGTISLYDYKSGHKFQAISTPKMPGSLESERGILANTFDQSGLRMITGETDKSIKIWKQDDTATKELNPGLPWNPLLSTQRF